MAFFNPGDCGRMKMCCGDYRFIWLCGSCFLGNCQLFLLNSVDLLRFVVGLLSSKAYANF